ncbi:MAG: DUF4268 domain-containing protein [Oscillospiraceae bacterium]|nr:DUF4268 domain-containing protein [Oscillospiraceae bacterium]
MKGYEEYLFKYMSGSSTHFIIPVYQRNYDWKTENCKQLFDDLVSVSKNKLNSHFFGSIVSVSDPEGGMLDFLIIDGQQRLTTVSLLFLAMYNLMQEGKIVPQKSNLAVQIYETFLIDKFEDDESKIKLKPIKNDQKAFEALFDPDLEKVADSNLTINYDYFYNRIQQEEITIDELFDAIRKLQIINISLNHEDNPQLIFESLNSTGMALSEGDKIRNYILMELPIKEQNQFYTKYWNQIEKMTDYDVSSFVRDYLSIKQMSTPNIKNVYVKFKEYKQEEYGKGLDTEDVLKEMWNYSKRYNKLISPNIILPTASKLDWCIYRLNRLKTTITRPFLLEVLRMNEKGSVNDNDLLEIFKTVETYIFRRLICDLPSNSLNKIFLTLHRDIIKLEDNEENYLEKCIYVLNSKKESGSFPSDEEFISALLQKNIYSMRPESKHYLFERLEHGGLKGGALDVWNSIDNKTLTIEHIMPQTLTAAWREDLGGDEESERIHNEWLHRLANLTLTAYNSEYKNHRFYDKCKTIKGGFAEGGLHINHWIKDQDKWTEEEILKRNDLLKGEALQIWNKPESNYEPVEKQLDSVTLNDDEDYTGKKIYKYSFEGVEHQVGSWADMYQQVLMRLHEKDGSVLTKLAVCNDANVDMSVHFSTQKADYNSCREIGENLYVWTGTNTQSKVSNLAKLLPQFGLDEDQLIFYFKDEDDEDEDISGTRYEIRKHYWQYAIDSIREKTGSFGNSGTTTSNSLSGASNRPSVWPVCVANFDSARVELYIDFGDWTKNKEYFDDLIIHKAEIESAFGDVLIWNRSEDTRASKVYFEIKNIGVINESDWPRMAKFHSEKMAALMKAAEPYM